MFRKNKSCCRHFKKTVKYNYKDKFMTPTFKKNFKRSPLPTNNFKKPLNMYYFFKHKKTWVKLEDSIYS